MGPVLQVRLHSGEVLAEWPMHEGTELQLGWAHSVTGGKVVDCFIHADGNLVLTRSYLHDFAAGLGEVAGRGQLVSATEGGYWIKGIDAALPGNRLSLRVGGPRVGHVLRMGAGMCERLDWDLEMQPEDGVQSLPLSRIAAGDGVWVSLMQMPDRADCFVDASGAARVPEGQVQSAGSGHASGVCTISDQP